MTSIADLFEPKLPPINLWCLPSASWFYRKFPQEATPVVNSVRTDRASALHSLYKTAQVYR